MEIEMKITEEAEYSGYIDTYITIFVWVYLYILISKFKAIP